MPIPSLGVIHLNGNSKMHKRGIANKKMLQQKHNVQIVLAEKTGQGDEGRFFTFSWTISVFRNCGMSIINPTPCVNPNAAVRRISRHADR
jgi:hypothetical protein